MTINELKNIIKDFSYKPGTEFIVEGKRDPFDLYNYRILIKIPIYYSAITGEKTDEPLRTHFCGNNLEHLTEKHLILAIENQIRQAEIHEMEEWLKLNGKLLRDPHPERDHGREIFKSFS